MALYRFAGNVLHQAQMGHMIYAQNTELGQKNPYDNVISASTPALTGAVNILHFNAPGTNTIIPLIIYRDNALYDEMNGDLNVNFNGNQQYSVLAVRMYQTTDGKNGFVIKGDVDEQIEQGYIEDRDIATIGSLTGNVGGSICIIIAVNSNNEYKMYAISKPSTTTFNIKGFSGDATIDSIGGKTQLNVISSFYSTSIMPGTLSDKVHHLEDNTNRLFGIAQQNYVSR